MILIFFIFVAALLTWPIWYKLFDLLTTRFAEWLVK